MNTVTINANHRRALTAAMQSVQRALDEFVRLIADDAHSALPQIGVERARQLTMRIDSARQQLRAFCRLFDIPMQKQRDPSWAIQVGVSSLWEILEDCKSEPMRGYGDVPETTKPILDAQIQSVIDVLESIAAAARGEK